jgi:hypothetical protein
MVSWLAYLSVPAQHSIMQPRLDRIAMATMRLASVVIMVRCGTPKAARPRHGIIGQDHGAQHLVRCMVWAVAAVVIVVQTVNHGIVNLHNDASLKRSGGDSQQVCNIPD